MIRLTGAQIKRLKRGECVEVFRRKGGGALWELHMASHGMPVEVVICTGIRCSERYSALVQIRRGKRMQGGDCIYGLWVSILKLGGRINGEVS